jgi:uncharacterized protein (TIGR00369 family)
MREVGFYFDYVSPYAYLAWRMARDRGLPLRPMPVVFGALLDHAGTLGPAEIPSKRVFLIKDCIRRADELGIPFTFPPAHPFRSLDALRASIDRPADVVDRLFAACWEQGRDLSDLEVLREVLHPLPLPGAEVKERLKDATSAAIAKGVFGVPTFEIDGELIWGSDRLGDVIAVAEGRSHLDPARVEKMLGTPIGVVRGAQKQVDPAAADRVRALFSDASFMRWLGARVDSIAPGMVLTSLEVRPDHLQQDGFVHAGVLTTLADHTAGAAAGTTSNRPLTIELKINLLRPAKGPFLRCRATVLKPGKTITVAESEVHDGDKLVAKAMVTLSVAPP